MIVNINDLFFIKNKIFLNRFKVFNCLLSIVKLRKNFNDKKWEKIY